MRVSVIGGKNGRGVGWVGGKVGSCSFCGLPGTQLSGSVWATWIRAAPPLPLTPPPPLSPLPSTLSPRSQYCGVLFIPLTATHCVTGQVQLLQLNLAAQHSLRKRAPPQAPDTVARKVQPP